VFGWPYAQHESYYVMVSSKGGKVFLGLHGDASVAEFERRAHVANARGIEFDIGAFVQTFPAVPHQLFLVPAGTPHGSSAGNVVLEVSATPYLYSLRFYDWLRRDRAGRQRPVHVDHAFRNLDISRVGDAVKQDLIQAPRTVSEGHRWREQLLGALPEMFFEVRRVTVGAEAHADQDTEGRFHVVTLVEGGPASIEYATLGVHNLAYAETLAIPAAVGAYRVHNRGRARLRIVKSVVSAT
jgi:mannose-6-phosphate isomerase class I